MNASAIVDRPQIKGQILVARCDYVRQRHGSSGLTRVLQALDPNVAETLRGLDRETWYPFVTLIHLDHSIASEMAEGDSGIFEELGAASARHRTEWLGEHASLISLHGFLTRVAEEHRSFHSFGKATYRRDGFRSGEIAFSEYPEAYDTFCRASRGYFLGVIELLTGKPGTVEEPRCQCRRDPACVFRLSW